MLYIDLLEVSGAGTMFPTELYRRGPGHSSSAAKAIAAYNPTMARAILEKGFERRTPFTIVDPRRYGQVLRQVRVDGFAASREEHTMGISSIAAPIVLRRGERTSGRPPGCWARGRWRSCRVSVGPRPPSAPRWRPVAEEGTR